MVDDDNDYDNDDGGGGGGGDHDENVEYEDNKNMRGREEVVEDRLGNKRGHRGRFGEDGVGDGDDDEHNGVINL